MDTVIFSVIKISLFSLRDSAQLNLGIQIECVRVCVRARRRRCRRTRRNQNVNEP